MTRALRFRFVAFGFIASLGLLSLPRTAQSQTSGTFTQFSRMINQHACHTAVLLPGGLVLVAGGALSYSVTATSAADLYEPTYGLFYNFPELTQQHSCGTTATLLPGNSETVLFAGDSSAELWNFSSDSSVPLPYPILNHTATLLQNGTVLIAGGTDSNGNSVASAEVFDPSTNTFTATGSMVWPRAYHTATLLPNGKVLIAGGRYACCSGQESLASTLKSAEIYDPVSATFSPTGNMIAQREQHTATTLNNGAVLVAGAWFSAVILRPPIVQARRFTIRLPVPSRGSAT